ncbi:hypothetical protein DPMN_110693 [Dreissena polymorpha]|uniref:Uncharacterized protein n=1 Tax=Dreissena polymorpha TaxID=45954 RepID=A0A9D4KCH1_DREPO|nr:hypothetical protein DPMN_110693 [Dreissena polymorpha]
MVADNSARLGLTINRGKSNVFNTNAYNNTPITVQGKAPEEVDTFTYLGGILIEWMQMLEPSSVKHEQNIWGSREIGITTNIRLFNTIVKPILYMEQRSGEPLSPQ